MLDCLQAHPGCTSPSSAGNCWLNCRNAVTGGDQIATETCVSVLTTAACK
jgi:hypothetical protein